MTSGLGMYKLLLRNTKSSSLRKEPDKYHILYRRRVLLTYYNPT